MIEARRRPIDDRLAAYFQAEAEWRYSKAEEYPDDPRNERCGLALLGLADYVISLGHADARLLVLDALDYGPDDVYTPYEEGAYLAARFRFGSPAESYGDFVTRFTEAEERGHSEAVADNRLPAAESY
jgi:hypothetical protein